MKIPGNHDDADKLTFSQREDKVPLPDPMKLEHVPRKFKQLVWATIEQAIDSQSIIQKQHYKFWNHSMERILFDYRHDVQGLLADDARIKPYEGPERDKEWVKELLNDAEYHDVLSFVEFVIRHESCPGTLSYTHFWCMS